MKRGYIALTSLLIAAALVVALAVGLTARSMSSSATSLDFQESARAKALAGACAEEAISRLSANLSYTGNETIMVGDSGCEIRAIAGSGGSNRSIETQATVNGYTAKLRVLVSSFSPQVTIGSWREVSDF
jgi:hypothetical protein